MLTPFGKFCRKIRIDQGELLRDMAQRLGVTSSYLSAVEVGKRNVPNTWARLLSEHYNLTDTEYRDMVRAIESSQRSLKFDLNSFNNDDKQTVLSFARDFKDLGDEDKARIQKILSGKGGIRGK